MNNSSNILWGSPALKDNNNFGLNRRNINVVSGNSNQGNDNNEESGPLSTTRLPWGSPLSPVGPYFGNPVSSSSPKTPYYASDKKQVSSRNYCGGGRNNLHDSGGGGGSRHQHHFQQQYTGYTPRYTSSSSSSPVTPFAGRGRSSSSSYHSSFSSSTQTHGGSSPACKQNRSGSNNSTQSRNSSSFFSTPKISSSFYQKSPYCSPNSPNFSFNQSFSAEDYFKPSMLEDPWEKLRKKKLVISPSNVVADYFIKALTFLE